MPLRNPFRRQPETPASTLRDRAADLRAVLTDSSQRAEDQPTDHGRRTMVAGALAAVVPMPSQATEAQISFMESAFLASIPQATPLLRDLIAAHAETTRLEIAAENEAEGPLPQKVDGQQITRSDRIAEARKALAVDRAWATANAIDKQLYDLLDDFSTVPMRSLDAILFKAALNELGEFWGESAVDDLRRLAAERFGLSAPDTAA